MPGTIRRVGGYDQRNLLGPQNSLAAFIWGMCDYSEAECRRTEQRQFPEGFIEVFHASEAGV